MTSLNEAYEVYDNKSDHVFHIDHFFTQRTISEEQEYFDKSLKRQIKTQKKICSLLAISTKIDNNSDYHIEIYGDTGYLYRGQHKTFEGTQPLLMIPIKNDKRIFICFSILDGNDIKKRITSFIDIPKRYQNTI